MNKHKKESNKTKKEDDNTTTSSSHEEHTLSWQSLEYPHFEKGTLWYSVLALITAGLVVLGFFIGDITLVLMILVGALAIVVLGSRKPETVTITIEGTTLTVGKQTHYDLGEMKSFWIHYEPPEDPELLLHSSRFFAPLVFIPLGRQDPLSLRTYLKEMLPEKREDIPLTNRIARALHF